MVKRLETVTCEGFKNNTKVVWFFRRFLLFILSDIITQRSETFFFQQQFFLTHKRVPKRCVFLLFSFCEK